MEEALRLEAIQHSYGKTSAVSQVFLSIESGSFFCLLGSSGCGKTTLLRLIGGYLQPQSGQIFYQWAEHHPETAGATRHWHGFPELCPLSSPLCS